MGHDFQAAIDRQLVSACRVPESHLWGRGKHSQIGGEAHMAKYLVRAAIPTVYIIDAADEQDAMHQAAERFKKEQHIWIEPELQWAEINGTDSTAIWRLAD
jgi:hypothetical protein